MNLIEKLQHLKDLISIENEVDVDSSIKVLDEAITALQASEWISVDDRLPEFNKHYLVLFETITKDIVQCVALFQNVKRCADINSKEYDATWYVYPSSGHKIKPTHWMPLPTPPTQS